jgi:hypothetical protein
MPATTQQTTREQAVRGFIWSVLDCYEATSGRGPVPTRIYEEARRLEPGCALCRGTPGKIGDAECWRCREEAQRHGDTELLSALGHSIHAEASHG